MNHIWFKKTWKRITVTSKCYICSFTTPAHWKRNLIKVLWAEYLPPTKKKSLHHVERTPPVLWSHCATFRYENRGFTKNTKKLREKCRWHLEVDAAHDEAVACHRSPARWGWKCEENARVRYEQGRGFQHRGRRIPDTGVRDEQGRSAGRPRWYDGCPRSGRRNEAGSDGLFMHTGVLTVIRSRGFKSWRRVLCLTLSQWNPSSQSISRLRLL